MAGARSVAIGSVAVDSLCVDALTHRTTTIDLALHRGAAVCRRKLTTRAASSASLELSSSFLDAWHGRRPSAMPMKKQNRNKRLLIVDDIGGQYEEGFEDVHGQIINFFTYKAVRTVLHQLYEMNPPKYMWFYNFVASNSPTDGKQFLRSLGKEKQDLAERVMITRLHLYGKWIKKCDHAKMYERISDENLQLMRERLMETVIWPNSDDTNMEKIG